MKRRSFRKKIWAFLEKINGLFFFRFYDYGPFEGRSAANVFNAFLLNTTLLGSLGYFLLIEHLMLNLTKCPLAAETFGIIH